MQSQRDYLAYALASDRDHVVVAQICLADRGLHAGVLGHPGDEQSARSEHAQEQLEPRLVKAAEAVLGDDEVRIVGERP